ncbi:hypothetical protein JS61_02435 [Rickettsia felis]|uniref:ankyrin repeat domain-containing protein n=1 Tax=Rickettsia felis TaxID=42862 RepID=UPI000574C42A|nr:ankyrin repeat domain-containing protein [Rickettsia felis]KHO03737.1 hypothetical protein JS61_02435 [Rickettsia felis]
MHKSLSYKALRDYFKTEKQILKEKFKEETKEKIKELIKTNQINEIDPIHGTALNRAIKIKDKKIILKLLDNNADTIKSLVFLIEKNKDIKEIKQFVYTFYSDNLLWFSIKFLIEKHRSIQDIKQLIDSSLSKTIIDFTVLQAVKNHKSLEDIRELIGSSKVSHDGLYEAVVQGRLDLVKYFIEEKRFDVNTTIDDPVHGGSILSIAIMNDRTDVMDYLLTKEAIASQGVISAIIKGNVKILEKLFKYGATAHDHSEDPVALVVSDAIAAYEPNYKALGSKPEHEPFTYIAMLRVLLEHGGNPNAVMLERGKVVLLALNSLIDKPENPTYKDICRLLIKHKADISIFNPDNDKHKKYITIIDLLKAEIIQEAETGSRLAAKSKFFSLEDLNKLDEETSLGGDTTELFNSKFEG